MSFTTNNLHVFNNVRNDKIAILIIILFFFKTICIQTLTFEFLHLLVHNDILKMREENVNGLQYVCIPKYSVLLKVVQMLNS